MTSAAYRKWLAERLPALDQLVEAHRALEGGGRGRRYATKQINHAYAVLLCSQFQGFARDLHSEAVDHLAGQVRPAVLGTLVRKSLTEGRKLDRGNANPGNLGNDFQRLGIRLWPLVQQRSRWSAGRQQKLELANTWRNAIAHQDFTDTRVSSDGTLHLATVRNWRNALEHLALDIDEVVEAELLNLTGTSPW
jgi:hypothetical protein